MGGFVGLRFGPGAYLYNAGMLSPNAIGITPNAETIISPTVKEAYVSWKPDAKFQIDLGKFSTWIGSEVADSQYNMNYTRSALFFTQPRGTAAFASISRWPTSSISSSSWCRA